MDQREFESVPDSTVVSCVWCAAPLGDGTSFISRTCLKCYRLLLNAGLTDKEIFGTDNVRIRENLPKTRFTLKSTS